MFLSLGAMYYPVHFIMPAVLLSPSAVVVMILQLLVVLFSLFAIVVGGYLGNGTIAPIPRSLQLGLSRGVTSQVCCKAVFLLLHGRNLLFTVCTMPRSYLSRTITTHLWNSSVHYVQPQLGLTSLRC